MGIICVVEDSLYSTDSVSTFVQVLRQIKYILCPFHFTREVYKIFLLQFDCLTHIFL